MDEQWIVVGERISGLRQNLGLTQEKLAEQADISIQFLVQIEHGKRTMKRGFKSFFPQKISTDAYF